MWKNGYPCRCRSCGSRRTLRQHPDHYTRRAPACGCGGAYRVDTFRQLREHKRNACTCGGYPFKHRRGSLYCQHGAAGAVGLCFFMALEDPHWTRDQLHARGVYRAAA